VTRWWVPSQFCSGLTHAAYAAAGVTIPRTADTQWHAGPPVPPGQPLAPGDLLFYGAAGRAMHVAPAAELDLATTDRVWLTVKAAELTVYLDPPPRRGHRRRPGG
jgi:NlpC/P60 family